MPFVENFSEFSARQGEYIQTTQGDFQDTFLFANGASCLVHKYGVLNGKLEGREPPTEKFALLQAKRLYVKTKLEREAQDYSAALADYKERSSNAVRYPDHCPPVPAGAMSSLRAGWDVVESLRQELKQLDAELTRSPEGILAQQRRELDERDSANMAARSRQANLFSSISPNGPPPTPSQDITEVVGQYLQNNK